MGQLSQEQLRLGRISFLNVLPIYYPLESGVVSHSFDIVSGTPAHLNQLMAQGRLDLSVISSIEYARHPERYLILPDLSISCCGAVKSVLLLSRVPIEELTGQTVLVSTQSHTSVALLKVLFENRFGMDAVFKPDSCTNSLARGENPTAFLAIGDEALRLRRHGSYPYCMDLGEAWHAWTGLPFVFALWVIQKKAVEKWNRRLDTAVERLSTAKEWGRAHLDTICTRAAQQGLLSFEELRDYYHCLRFDLGREEQRGLELFFRYLTQIGEIPETPGLGIHTPLACVA
jgi:chorismate dehydratase